MASCTTEATARVLFLIPSSACQAWWTGNEEVGWASRSVKTFQLITKTQHPPIRAPLLTSDAVSPSEVGHFLCVDVAILPLLFLFLISIQATKLLSLQWLICSVPFPDTLFFTPSLPISSLPLYLCKFLFAFHPSTVAFSPLNYILCIPFSTLYVGLFPAII